MKLLLTYFAILVSLTVTTAAVKKIPAQEVSVNFQVFYDNLSPYGQWVNYNDYGYAWVPTAGVDFVPYSTGGHWALTDFGWTWISDYNWGWAPFHYGRWDYDDYYGWLWIPDYEWGPAWVSWRRCPGYYGWAPLGPNISVHIAIGDEYRIPYHHWTFVQERYIGRHDINRYYGPRTENEKYVNSSTVINNTYIDNNRHSTYIAGPKKEEVEKTTGAPINQVAVRENSQPGQSLKGNELSIYRPTISKGDNSIKPSKIADKKDVTPVSERASDKNPANNKNQPLPANPERSKTDQQKQNTQPSPQQKQEHPVQQVKPNQAPKVNREEQQKPATSKPAQVPQQQHNQAPQPNPQRQNPMPNPNQERHQNMPNNQPQQHNTSQPPNHVRQNPMPNPNQERHQNEPPARPQPMPPAPPQRVEQHPPRH